MIRPIQRLHIIVRKKHEHEIEKLPLKYVNLERVDIFLIASPNKNNINIDVSNIMNPAFLLGIAFNIE